ncbi:MAG: NADAR family protein, partial [Chryseobacterium sp.]|nr:NADAR family protein [Chryseobacterium sp.]
VEASPYDTIWGIGMLETDSRAKNPANWDGENLLGFALMEVRDQIRT